MRPAGARHTSEVGCHRSEIKRSAFNCEAGISLAPIARISSKESSPLPTLGYGSSNRQAASNFKLVSRHAQMRRQCRTLGCRTRIEARTSKQNTANILSSLIQSERHWGRGPSPGATWPPKRFFCTFSAVVVFVVAVILFYMLSQVLSSQITWGRACPMKHYPTVWPDFRSISAAQAYSMLSLSFCQDSLDSRLTGPLLHVGKPHN